MSEPHASRRLRVVPDPEAPTPDARKRSVEPAKESRRHVASVLGALSILDCFESDEALSLKEIHLRTGLNKSRIIRYAGSLEEAGMIDYDCRSGVYQLGTKMLQLGNMLVKSYSPLVRMVRPALERLVAATRSTAYCSVIRGLNRLVLVREEPSEGLRYGIREGLIRPIFVGASSQVLLAFSEDLTRRRLMARLRRSLAPAELRRFNGIVELLPEVRERHFAIAQGTIAPDSESVAAPILSKDRRLIGALTVVAPREVVARGGGGAHAAELLKSETERMRPLLD